MTEIWKTLLYSLLVLCYQGLPLVPGDYYILGNFDQDAWPLCVSVLFRGKWNSFNQSTICVRNLRVVITDCEVLELSAYLHLFPLNHWSQASWLGFVEKGIVFWATRFLFYPPRSSLVTGTQWPETVNSPAGWQVLIVQVAGSAVRGAAGAGGAGKAGSLHSEK